MSESSFAGDVPTLPGWAYVLVGGVVSVGFLVAFPFEVAFWSDVLIEGLYLVLVAVLAVFVRRLEVPLLEAGWMIFTLARLVDFLDELVVEPNPWVNPYLGGVLTIGGLGLAVGGAYIAVDERATRIETLERTREQLALVNRLLRHDIRNDMMVIVGRLDYLRDEVDPDVREHVDTLVETGEHVVELTQAVRDVMTVIEGGEGIELERVDLAGLLESEIERARDTHEGATIEAPETDDRLVVRANAMLSSVLRNLIDNAVEHNDKSTPRVEIAVDRDPDAGTVLVRIADNGPGIPDEQKRAVFGRGEKGLDSEGLGLGLYLVRTLVDAFDGTVRVEDNDPEGTVVTVELPAAD